MTMGANRYSRLIKNSSEEDLKLYIYIIESELGYRKGEVIDLSNTQKSNLQFKLGELIREKLDIEWKYLEGDDLTEYENEDLDDFINTLFLRAQQVRGDIRKQLEWLSEPRPLYFFSVLMRAVINSQITDLSYPVTSVDFKTAKSNNNLGKFAQLALESFTKTHFLESLRNICPNQTSSTHDRIVRTLEYIAVSCNLDEQRAILKIINDIESLYQISCYTINTDLNALTSSDKELNAWYYRLLMNRYPGTGLRVTDDPIKQKHTILCIFDVICVTTPPNAPTKDSKQVTFKKVLKRLTDDFSRRENREKDGSSTTNNKRSKAEKTLTFSEMDWDKLIELTGNDAKNKIKAKLKELIDRELAEQKDAKEGSGNQETNGETQTPDKNKDSKQSDNDLFNKLSFGRRLLK